jgi:hypothetical protein
LSCATAAPKRRCCAACAAPAWWRALGGLAKGVGQAARVPLAATRATAAMRLFPGRRARGGLGGCQVASDLASSHEMWANPQVGAGRYLGRHVVVVHAAQKLATSVETNGAWLVSGQLANGQVISMNSGQTKGDPTGVMRRRSRRAAGRLAGADARREAGSLVMTG